MSNNSTKSPATKAADGSGGVQSVDRADQRAGDPGPRGEAGVSEVAADIGVHKSTAFRLLGALEARGLVEQNQRPRQVPARLRHRCGWPARSPAGWTSSARAARSASELAAEFDETVNLAVLRSHYAVNVDQARGPAAVAAHNWVGQLTPLHATSSGKVLLAHLEPESARAAARRRRSGPASPTHTITARNGARGAARDRLARDGYAYDVRGVRGRPQRRWRRPCATTPATVIAAPQRLGAGLPLRPKSRMQRRCSERLRARRGPDRRPDGPPAH